MLRVDGSLDHIPARRGHVVSLYESINQPLVNIPGYGAAPTGAFILGTRNDHGAFTVFVYLYQPQTQAVLIYISDPRSLTAEQLRKEEAEAVRFVESMGFMVDDVQFGQLGPSEQEAVMERVPMFRPLSAREVVEGRPTSEARFGVLGGVVTGRPESQQASAPPGPRTQDGTASGSYPVPSSPHPLPSGLHQPQPSSFFTREGSLAGEGEGRGSPAPGLPLEGRNGAASPPSTEPVGARAIESVERSASTASSLGRGLPAAPPPPSAEPRRASLSATPEAVARIGRLLGTFGFLLALGMTPVGCASGGADQEKLMKAEVGMGERQLALHNWAEGLRHFQAVLDKDEDNPEAHQGAGVAYLQLGRIDKSETHLRRAIEGRPDWSEAKNVLAVVLMEQRQCDEAQSLLLEVTDDVFYPNQHFAEHNLARAEACLGDIGAAVRRLQRLNQKRPKFCKGYLTASQLAENAALHEATVEACERFRENCEQDERIGEKIPPGVRAICQLRKGRAYVALGDIESARTAFKRCESAKSTRSTCRDALDLLPP